MSMIEKQIEELEELVADLADVWNYEANDKDYIKVRNAIDTIQELQKKVDKQKWHVVANGDLPETEDGTSDCFLVTDGRFRWLAYPIYDKNFEMYDWVFVNGKEEHPIDWTEIVAWMPLPEAWKEKE